MKRLLFFFLIPLIVSHSVFAQTKQHKGVAKAIEILRKAMVDGDRAALDNSTAEGLSYGHSAGKIEDKATFIENIVSGNSDFVSIELTDQTIYISGKTAIVRHKLSASTNDKGKDPGTVKLAILTVWQKDKKEWKLLARQAVKI